MGLVVTGLMFESSSLVTELMGPSVREGPPLTSAQEAAAAEALQQLHAAGILQRGVHAGNLLLLASPAHQHQQHARPRWADFGVASLCTDQESRAMELQECREIATLSAFSEGVSNDTGLSLRSTLCVLATIPRRTGHKLYIICMQ